MTEKEVSWEIESFLKENGSESLPFDLIVASGPRSALPHAQPTERPIQKGEPIVVDIGARVDGYCSDLTRTFYLGEADSTFAKVYDIVLGAQLAAIATLESGMSGEQADRLARTVIEEAGHGKDFGHSLGHGVGLACHEEPRLAPRVSSKLIDGMVFTVEPGIYITGWGGVRIEDMVVLEKGKPKVLSQASKIR
jgi:Xaa-Pro aminopeptidase